VNVLDSANILVESCRFKIVDSGYGALALRALNNYTVISNSFFANSRSEYQGGAIYF
jgi:hypothetical protein